MKNYLLVILTLIPIILCSYTIEETLSQIESLKKELSHNEQIVEEKISNLIENNPLFAEQDPFESSTEYAERLKKGQPIFANIRKQYLDDLWQKLGILRGRMFETENVTITLGKYNPDSQTYPMRITHLDYQIEIFNITVDIERDNAKLLYQNWNKVKKTGILTIDIGDVIGLAKIQIDEPISGFNFTYEMQPMKSYKYGNYFARSASFSPNGFLLAIGSDFNKIFIENVIDDKLNLSLKSLAKEIYEVRFSDDNSYILANNHYLFNLNTGLQVFNFKLVDYIIFSSTGQFICSISNEKHFSPDNKYQVKVENDFANIYRTFNQPESAILATRVISLPPSLSATVSFDEISGNQYLDALEKGEIVVTVTNTGKGSGKGLAIKFVPERIQGLNYNNSFIEEIPAGKSLTVKIPIEAYIGAVEADHLLRINFDEINGFPPAPVEIGFSTKAYIKPEMFIVDVGIEDSNKNGMIESGETTKLTVRLGNKGMGIATGAYAKFYSDDNVFITDSYPKIVSLGDLEYNQQIDIPLEFFINDRAADEIPLYVDITEATGLSGVDHLRIPILKSERTREIKRTVVSGIDKNYEDFAFDEDLSIDIEKEIPQAKKSNKNAIAIILGIESYRNVSDVNYAYRDAIIMKEYFSKTMGIPEEQIYFKANDEVTLGEFNKIFSKNGWLDKRVEEDETEIYFYYAGHGAPAIKEEKAFLIPYDGDPNYPVQTGYSLETVFEDLSRLKAKSVTCFLDACFTGANRENEMLLADARPVSIRLKNSYVNNVTVFSATSSNEVSSSYPKNKHGLFSYFLMKGMQGEADSNKDSKLTIQELFDFTKNNVSKTAGTLDREQTPQLECIDSNKIIINY